MRPIAVTALLLLAGCAGGPSAGDAQPLAPQPQAGSASTAAPAAAYALSAEEQKLDCKALTGRIHVRIRQIRDAPHRSETSTVTRTIQSIATPIYGGTTRGLDPAAELARDRAMIEAFNRRLAEKKCKTVDIEAELGGKKGPAAPAPAKPQQPAAGKG